MKATIATHLIVTACVAFQSACIEEMARDTELALVHELALAQEVVQAHELAQARARFERGVVLHMDGDDYTLDGPKEHGVRDIPGHVWVRTGRNRLFGVHYNTGPLGLSRWWSSDADDGALLYYVIAEIDTWSPSKADWYAERGFTHYHELVTVRGRRPHPGKVAWMKHIAVSRFTFDGGPMPWMAHPVRPGVDRMFMSNGKIPYPPREELLYVGCVDVGGQDPDFLAVVGADADDPATFSKIIHRVDMPELGDEIHHFGFNVMQTRLLIPGLFSGRMHLINIEDDPARPYLDSYNDTLVEDSGYIVPHTVIGTPDGGYMVSMIGSDTPDTASGGIVKLDSQARFVEPFGPPAVRASGTTAPRYMYDIGINLMRNRMISTSFGLPADVAGGITVDGLGNHLYVWDYQARKVVQVEDIGAGTGPLEVRWLNEPGSTIGYTNAPGTSEIWMWSDLDLDGQYTFQRAITLPAGATPTDILLSEDDAYLYVANWMASSVMQFDISDPFHPWLVAEVAVPNAQMMRLSPDNRRLYVTNSLLSTWDDTEFPAGVTRNQEYGIYLIDIDHDHGGMTLDNDFFVDLTSVQKQTTVGPARPHQVFFDANVRRGFGAH